jgi:ribosome-associated heat shock protein Hsp15
MTEDRQRVDRWLFFARVVKSRTLAARLVQNGRVRINGDKIDQASHNLRPGDTLTVTLDRTVRILRVVAPGQRRGPAEEARTLYEDITPAAERADTPLPSALPPIREPGTGRPTKRERRRLDLWKESGDE